VATPQEETLEGEITRITFQNDDTGFRVLKVKVDGRTDKLTVVGAFPKVNVGSRVRVRGTFHNDSKFGEQFRAAQLLELAPITLEGLEKYLGSGVIKGVGGTYAKRIVAVFGEATLQVLDSEPERLREVPGLGRSRVDAIIRGWKEQAGMREAMVFLQAHGASPALAMRIYKRYGQNTMNQVSRDPFRMTIDIWGVGFKTADKIAAAMGLAKDSVERALAAVLQAIRDVTDAGHTMTPFQDLAARTSALLELETDTSELIELAVKRAILERLLVEESVQGAHILSPVRLYVAELGIAQGLARAGRHGVSLASRASAAVQKFQADVDIELTVEQRAAIDKVAENAVCVLTGGPGVGKTTVVRAILNMFLAANLTVRLAAPTGRAAKRITETTGMEASTLHRLLEFEPKTQEWRRNVERPLAAQAFIVDESSMLDSEMAAALFAALPRGARLVLVGDRDQLPSVGPGAVLRDIIESAEVATARLTLIQRQGERSLIVRNAHRIHQGEAPLGPEEGGPQDFFVIERRDPIATNETIVELVKTRIPRRFGFDPVRDVQVLTPMHRGDAGAIALNASLQSALNPVGPSITRGQIIFRVGDKVMQLRNDYDRDVFNGDVGRITSADLEERSLVVRFDDRDVTYEESNLDELTLAYACTIHKSQGSEYPAVVIPMLTTHFVMLSRNLLYTAVTRGRKLVVLVCDPRAVKMALSEDRKDERRTRLCARIREAVQAKSLQSAHE
jgi:exodeoxyribonuclease V alpha subunit